MTTPSGQISMADVETELGISVGTQITLNDTNVRRLAGVVSTGYSEYSTAGNYTYTVPSGIYTLYVATLGGGGGGQSGWGNYSGSGGAGAGGGAGTYVTQTLSVTPGQVLNLTVGAGGAGGSGAGAYGGTSPNGAAGSNGTITFISGYPSTNAAGGVGGNKATTSGNFNTSYPNGNWAGDGGSWWYGYVGASSIGSGGTAGGIYTDGGTGGIGAGGGGGAASNYSPNDYNTAGGNGGPGYISISTSTISMKDLRNKTWVKNLAGTQSAAGCYSAQGGFSVDRHSDGLVYLTMGVWPTDPPNCQTCSWQWLNNGGVGSTSSYNSYRAANNTRPFWTKVWKVNITAMSIGQTYETRPDFNDLYGTSIYGSAWPYSNVSYTYRITKTASNAISIVVYPNSWGTGDTGTSISVSNWWNNILSLSGGSPPSGGGKSPYYPAVLGSINLSWTDLGY